MPIIAVEENDTSRKTLDVHELARALKSEIEDQGWLKTHLQEAQASASATKAELRRVQSELDRRDLDVLQLREELRISRGEFEDQRRQNAILGNELNHAAAELRLSATRQDDNELDLARKSIEIGQLKDNLHACDAALAVAEAVTRTKTQELIEAQGRLCKYAEESGRLREQQDNRERMGLEAANALREQIQELGKFKEQHERLNGALELLQTQSKEAHGELCSKNQELELAKIELTDTRSRLEERNGTLGVLQKQDEETRRDLGVKHQELLSTQTELANAQEQLTRQLHTANVASGELEKAMAALLDSQVQYRKSHTQYRKCVCDLVHVSLWLLIHLQLPPGGVIECLPATIILLLSSLPHLRERDYLDRVSVILLSALGLLARKFPKIHKLYIGMAELAYLAFVVNSCRSY